MAPESSGPRQAAAGVAAKSRAADQIARSIVLVVLFATPALMCLHAAIMSDPDIWWHLRTGEWILHHHAVPRVDSFSNDGMGKPWTAYSWLFELLVFKLYQWFGMAGIVIYIAASVAAIGAAFYMLVDRLQTDFVKSALLTIAGVICLSGNLTPRPWMLTIVFFLVELDILMQARCSGRAGLLLWLPPLFALWANVHIQFIDGLVLLGIAAVEPLFSRWWPWPQTRLRAGILWPILGACVLAALVNPYGWRVYQAAYDVVSQSGGANLIADLGPLRFRDLADFVLLFLALGSAAALAWGRRPPFFETAFIALGAYLAFHSMRDRWFLAAACCAVLASALPGDERLRRPLPAFAMPLILVAVAALLWAGVRLFGIDDQRLKSSLAVEYPVYAVEAARENGLTGRLFNDFDWGGYLIWALPDHPVSIDGRTAVHGNLRVARNVDTWSAKPGWESDPDLQAAGLIIAPVSLPLTELLRLDSRFRLVYHDKLAAVFVRVAAPAGAAHAKASVAGPAR